MYLVSSVARLWALPLRRLFLDTLRIEDLDASTLFEIPRGFSLDMLLGLSVFVMLITRLSDPSKSSVVSFH